MKNELADALKEASHLHRDSRTLAKLTEAAVRRRVAQGKGASTEAARHVLGLIGAVEERYAAFAAEMASAFEKIAKGEP